MNALKCNTSCRKVGCMVSSYMYNYIIDNIVDTSYLLCIIVYIFRCTTETLSRFFHITIGKFSSTKQHSLHIFISSLCRLLDNKLNILNKYYTPFSDQHVLH